jgi:hypothetical protein
MQPGFRLRNRASFPSYLPGKQKLEAETRFLHRPDPLPHRLRRRKRVSFPILALKQKLQAETRFLECGLKMLKKPIQGRRVR